MFAARRIGKLKICKTKVEKTYKSFNEGGNKGLGAKAPVNAL